MQASTFVTGTKVWPWMAYCMYAHPRYGTPSTRRTHIYAIYEDGKEMEVTPDFMNLGWFAWKDKIRNPLFADKPKPIRESVDRIEAAPDSEGRRKVVEIRLHITKYKLIDGERVTDSSIKHITQEDMTVPNNG